MRLKVRWHKADDRRDVEVRWSQLITISVIEVFDLLAGRRKVR